MNNLYFVLAFIVSLFLMPLRSQAQTAESGTKLDQIVAVVNDHIILKSEVDQQVQQYMYQMQQQQSQQIPFGDDLWYSVLENTIDQYVMLDQAKIDSVTVTNEEVNQRINQRVNSSIQQLGSEEALEKQMGKSLVQIRADLRKDFREQMTIQRLRLTKGQEIDITRPEINKYFEQIPRDSLPTIPERVAVSQIVKLPEPLKDAKQSAQKLAEQLRDSVLNHGKSIEDMSRKYGDGPNSSNGGKLPMMSINDLVSEYSAAAAALEPGEISEVVETSFGFHVIRLNKREGDQIDTNHILITVDSQNYDDQTAKDRLEQLRDSVMNNEDVTFAEVARQFSEDPNTAPQGGRILNPQTGERLIALNELDPALYRIVLILDEEGDISQPRPFNLGQNNNDTKRGFRIVRLDNHVPEHVANLDQDYERIKRSALQNKQSETISEWIAELRQEMYVKYKIPVPEQFKNS